MLKTTKPSVQSREDTHLERSKDQQSSARKDDKPTASEISRTSGTMNKPRSESMMQK